LPTSSSIPRTRGRASTSLPAWVKDLGFAVDEGQFLTIIPNSEREGETATAAENGNV
jgi:hypothetical protein